MAEIRSLTLHVNSRTLTGAPSAARGLSDLSDSPVRKPNGLLTLILQCNKLCNKRHDIMIMILLHDLLHCFLCVIWFATKDKIKNGDAQTYISYVRQKYFSPFTLSDSIASFWTFSF